MKSIGVIRFSTSITAILLASATTLVAQNVAVDEFGNGTVNGGGPLPSQVAGGGLGLQYTLPYIVYPGEVVIHDTSLSGPVSDVIVFTNTFLFFQSGGSGGGNAPADVPSFLIQSGVPRQDIIEQASGGLTFATYTPLSGMPGYDLVDSTSPNYTFISDVPEPAAGLLAILGGGLVLVRRWRQQVRRN